MLRTLLRNTAAGYALKALQMFLGLIAIPVLVTQVGADSYGLIVLAGAMLGYFSVFDLGMSDAITKFIAEHEATGDRKQIDRVISTALVTYMAIGVSLCVIVIFAIQFGALEIFDISESLRSDAHVIFTLTAGLSLLAWPRLALQGVLRGLQDFVPLNVVSGLGRVLAVSLAITLAFSNAPLTTIYLAMQMDLFVALVFLPMLVRRRLPGWIPSFGQVRRATLATIWSFSLWLMLSKVAVLLEYQLDTLILGLVLPMSAITAYVVLTYPFRMLQQFSGLAAAAAMPAVSSAASAGNVTAVALFRLKGARIHNAILAVMTGTVLLVLEPFLRLWMGTAWLDQIWIAYVATGFQFIWQSNAFLGQVYTGLGFAKKSGIVAFIAGLANLVLSLGLVQLLGVAGVILGTVLAGLIGVVLFVHWCLPDIGVTPRVYLRDILLRGQASVWIAFLVLLVCVYTIDIQVVSWGGVVVLGSLFMLVLGAVAFLYAFDNDDRATIREIVCNRM